MLIENIRKIMNVGDEAIDFELETEKGLFRLSDLRGRRILLVFYPGDETPVCTAQLCDYKDGIEIFKDLNVEVVGISKDDPVSHRSFRRKYNLPFTLASDEDLSVSDAYGVRSMLPSSKRAVFLIDENGIIRYKHVEIVSFFRRRKEDIISEIKKLDRNREADQPDTE